MSDEIDLSTERSSQELDFNIQAIRDKAAAIPEGVSGICYYCDEESKRLVGGMCEPCRDVRDRLYRSR
jgi:hypothetical protein